MASVQPSYSFADDERFRPVEALGKSFDIPAERPCFRGSVTDDFFDNSIDGCSIEVDLLTEMVPEEDRLTRLEDIQPAFQDEGQEPYMSSVRLMRELFDVPISLMSLVYEKFQWFKAGLGVDTNQSERCNSFCVHTFIPIQPQVLYVPDATQDVRFRDNPLVTGPPFIRFYCGVPLVTQDNVRLGALCIIDRKPRVMGEDDMRILINLAELAMRELMKVEISRNLSAGPAHIPSPKDIPSPKAPTVRQPRNLRMHHKIGMSPTPSPLAKPMRHLPSLRNIQKNRQTWFEQGLAEGHVVIDTTAPQWQVKWSNPAWVEWTNRTGVGCIKRDFWGVLNPVGGEPGWHMQEQILTRIASDKSGSVRFLSRVSCRLSVASKLTLCVATLATRPVCAQACNITLPSREMEATSDATPINSSSWRLLIVTMKPLNEEDAAKLTDPSVTFETPPEVSVMYHQVDLEKDLSQLNFKLLPVYDTFRKFDKTATMKLERRVLVMVMEELGSDGAVIEKLLDASGLVKNGEICYRNLLLWLSASSK